MTLHDSDYYVGYVSLSCLAERYGLPLYVYDAFQMQEQLERMKSSFNVKSLKIHYACKALSNINVLRMFRRLGTGLDTVSIQEVWKGLKAGFDPKDIMFTPNCVSLEELELAVQEGVQINVDNLSMLEQFGTLHPEVPVCIRVNPHIMAGGNSKISVGHIDSKFGISIHQIPHVKRIIEATGLKVQGLHMHNGSDILDTDVFLQGVEILFEIAAGFKDLRFIDLGSGFKVAYKPNDLTTELETLGALLSARFNSFCDQYGRDLDLIFEPGKFLVSESGYFLARVNVVKQTTSTVFAGLDTGFNHLIRPMFYHAYHEIINVSNPNGRPRIYTIVGYICETDTFGWNRKISEIREGDILAVKNAGAYCFEMASNYNSRFRPAEVLIYEGKDYLIRERETMNDLFRNQVELSLF